MKCNTAKRFLRPQAIKHYITENNGSIYHFMSLYSDNEPYPINELVEIQKQVIGEIMADYKLCASEFLEQQLKQAERLLKRIEHREKQLMSGNTEYKTELEQIQANNNTQ
ncbi:hypothetical protein [Lonepinella sp. MS14437]|uniref:hypothetical protein n=1 Tax=Lonepinella sp. MS14437 TaxID=3003620 RepID=UPI0036DA2B54